MRQTRKLKRRRKRQLRKGFKIFLIVTLVIATLALIIALGFKLKTVRTSLDLGQFTNKEVMEYIDQKEIDNTLIFWLKNKTGNSVEIELFEEYDVKMLSPIEVKITAYEKKLKGAIKNENQFYYFDERGTILKVAKDRLKGIPKVQGLKCKELKLYHKIKPEDEKQLKSILDVTSKVEKYNFNIKKVKINKDSEVSIYVKKLQIQLGKNISMDKKLKTLNDMYSKVVEQKGILNMKHVSDDGSYTVKKIEEKKKQNK